MDRFSQQRIIHIMDLMRMDSNNFTELVSKELRDQLIEVYGLTPKEIDMIELTLSKAYKNIFKMFD